MPDARLKAPLVTTLLAGTFLAGLPALAGAEDFALPSQVSAVTLYPSAATVRREVSYSIPEGRHALVLSDMPFIDPAALRLQAGEGVELGPVTYRDDFVPPRSKEDSVAIAEARNRIEALEEKLEEIEARAAQVDLEAEAAMARVSFLQGMSSSAGTSASPEDLRALLLTISAEDLEARRIAQEARDRAAEIREEKTPVKEELETAEEALAALLNEDEERSSLSVTLTADAPREGVLVLSYTTDQASWRPAYDMALSTGETPEMTLTRAAFLRQETGENWQDVALTLSTARPSDRAQPGELQPLPLRIFEPGRPIPLARQSEVMEDSMSLQRLGAAPVAGKIADNGVSITYGYPEALSLDSGAEELRVDLGTTRFTPEVYARAVPLLDENAYLMAGFTNQEDEPLLPGAQTRFFVDGTYMGQRPTPLVAAGASADWSFGAIDGLRLERRVEDRMEGEEGFIRKSNGLNEAVTITLTNRTNRDWPLRLTDRVPYSEQEALQIDWQANPAPTTESPEGQRGLLEWQLDLPAGEETEVALSYSASWPADKVLQ